MCDQHPTTTPVRRPLGRRAVLRGAGGLLVAGGAATAAAPSAFAATSQNGWPAGYSNEIPLSSLAVGAATFPAGVRSGDVYTVLRHVAARFDATVERLYSPGCWGHNYREISGSTNLSNHASGTAIDCNAPDHPLGASGTFTSAQVSAIRAILSQCNGVVRWGGDYSSRKDEMHFEINVAPGDSRLSSLAASLGGGGGTPAPPAQWALVRQGDSGFRVRHVQYLLRQRGYSIGIDGVFGSGTASTVRSFQSSRGLTADGIVGTNTWTALVLTVRNGSSGDAVRAVQTSLTAKGLSTGVDGIFGSGTESRVRSFQDSRSLVVDGIVGENTWQALTA
ncbi:peptidoglycan-binding protein [Phycicoccus sp. BSK3Z-2]|uniref:Peptidoglycan-binding protein n=1 Tax=Phycicoccus avicenniae TaxID=2828860 RepID=A0A941D631_9MICO|nr:peptidoglycan-binding protein [Phycicoccus avicenniae]MBR7742288.1 peptidoglycan-binding protein [Phycicoccus avicenniae]